MKTNNNGFSLLRNCIISLQFCFIYLLLMPNRLAAQNINNLHIEKVPEDGLLNSFINCISQDSNGFMWFGTTEGLYRYDGYNFKSFRNFPGDSTTLSNNVIYMLYPEGRHLWVGTVTGLSCIDIDSQTIKNIPTPRPFQVNALLPSGGDTFWVGTTIGLYQYNKVTSQWKTIPAIGKNVFAGSIIDDKKGHLYILSKGGFYCYTKSTGSSKFYNPSFPVYPLEGKDWLLSYSKGYLDGQGNLWMGAWDAGLIKFDTKTQKFDVWSHQTDDTHFLPYKIIMDILPDDNGNLWLANKEGGLTIFDPSKNKFANYPVDWKSDTKLSGSAIALFRDKSGIFWIGTENGIYKYDPHRVYLSKTDIQLKTDTGLVESHISPISMLKDKGGLWWMGMYEGLFVYDPQTHVLEDYNKKAGLAPSFAVFNILQDANGTIWFTSRNLLVKIVKKPLNKTDEFKTEIYSSPDIQSTIYNLYIDRENRIWAGTSKNGIFRFDQSSKKFISYHFNVIGARYRIKEIRAFCELSKDSLLVGGDHTGLFLLHVNADRFEKVRWETPGGKLADDMSVETLYEKGSNVWIGTESNGLWQTDTHLNEPSILTINDGLPSMSIGSITSDNKNNLWLVSKAGIVEYGLQDKKISVFDKKDGITSVYQMKLMMNDDQGIIITSRGCLYDFNPADIIKNTMPPKVFINDLRVFDKHYDLQKNQTIELDYNQNYFTLGYVALNYTQPRFNHYAYKMVGLDKKWNDAGSRRYVSYANLEEGTYVFNVKACNNEGVWTNVPAKLTLIIKPPFWHRWWFYLLALVFVLSIIYIVYAYNINQLKIRLQLRDKIARDLHDDIGSTLSGINIFSKIALQKMYSDQKGSSELLQKISERSEKTMDALSDIVWSINTRNDGMDNFFMKAKEHLSEVLEPQGIAYDFKADPEMEQLKIGMIFRKELYLIFKEAVCNASKYAQCTFIHVSLTKHKDTCTLIIQDNGKGFDVSQVSSGNGIYNLKQRAAKMNAKLHIESEKDKGTLITLNFHIPRFR